MMISRQNLSRLIPPLALATVMVIGGLPMAAIAQYNPPANLGLPGRREGGGTRGNCLPGQAPLVALMPDTNIGLTTAEEPTLFWYVPPQSVETAEFIVLDAEDNIVHETTINLPESGGVIGVPIPMMDGASSLVLDENYHWYFSLLCNPDDRSADIFTEGWIRRVTADPALVDQLATANDSDRSTIYAQAGIWYDALATLATQRLNDTGSLALQGKWIDLLRSVELDVISEEPLVPCCTQ
jgi:hypothetical protein